MQPEQSFGKGGLNGFLDVDELVERIGLDEDEVEWRKHFIGFGEDDEQRLSDLEPLLRDNRQEIADDFYENVLQYEGTRKVINRSPKGVEALKETQQAYLVSLATGDYDLSYFENRTRIGKLHEMLDMPLKHYVGQYGVYYDLLLSRMNERVQDQVVDAIEEWAAEREAERDEGGLGRFVGALGLGGDDDADDGLEESFEAAVRNAIDDGMMDILSLLRIINLDMQIATETYVDSYAKRLEESIERRKRLASEVETDVQAPLSELHESSEVVSKRAEAISQHTESQAAGVTRAARELDEVSAAVEEVASVADEVSDESARTEQLAAEGVEAADDALDELEEIENATDRVADAVDSLAERTEEIDEVVDRLDDLAERTTVLAANAKIESSRGGGGDTMGVIANEVRSFAEQTKSDLAEIESAVEAVREDASATVATTEETVTRVDAGTDRVRETVHSLESIHESAQKTATGMEDVAAAADQQARGVEATAETIAELSQSADKVASAAESVAAASQEQTASLREVRDSVARLTGDEQETEPPVYKQVN
ncbi:protoglobin domain-containing protein [Haloarchaeobius amylolyticus]|uniref:Protoglobin domain-containing protein n=1 Tax=Haloarchaeobius amylolyticus TaxID=1198296 RepID=A0ABD6BEU3_9EURY